MEEKTHLGRSWAPAAVLFTGLALTTLASLLFHANTEAQSERRFEVAARDLQDALTTRMETYIALQRGGAALFEVLTNVSQADWRAYVTRLRIPEYYPGVQGVGFTRRIPSNELAQVTAQVRNEGLKQFRVWPDFPREEFHAIVLLEPLDARNSAAIGYDMLTERVRRAAMEEAWTNGAAVCSGKVRLVQETTEPTQAGFLIYTPVYRGRSIPGTAQARRAALVGFVYSPFRADDLFRGLASPGGPVSLEVYDGPVEQKNLLHRSKPQTKQRQVPHHSTTRTVTVAGRTWTLRMFSTASFDENSLWPVQFILPLSGTLVSLLLFGMVRRETVVRRRLELTARELSYQREQLKIDIAARQKAENALRIAQEQLSRQNEALESKVTERTAQLRESMATLESFSYSVSHDMRAPLRAMRGFSDILLEEYGEKLGPEGRSYLEKIRTAAGRLDNLTHDVLNYSRISGELPLEPVDLDRLTREILDSYPHLQEPDATVHIEGPLPVVLGNPAALTQCIANLLGNAVKFVPSGRKPQVRVTAYTEGKVVKLNFIDNGIGLSPEQLPKLFNMFHRGAHGYEGTGVGLAIVRKAVERMGGRVGVESTPGQGSRFWMELRAA